MFPDKNYTVARGELWFTPFVEGTRILDTAGARYIGNTPEISLTTETETLDHYDADHGLREKDDSVVLEKNTNGTFTADDIKPENLAMLFLGTAGVVTQTAQPTNTNTFPGAKKGRRLQLGVTPANPSGVRSVTIATVTAVLAGVGSPVPLVLDVDYRAEPETGCIILLSTGTLLTNDPDDSVTVTFAVAAVSYLQVLSGDLQIQGQLAYYAYNTKGARFDHIFPYVNIRPDGDYTLGGDDWQIMSFAFDALKRDYTTPVVITNGRPGVGIDSNITT